MMVTIATAVEIKKLEDAEKARLIQLTVWLHNTDIAWLEKEMKRITKDKKRTAMIVKDGFRYALFVNDVTYSKEV